MFCTRSADVFTLVFSVFVCVCTPQGVGRDCHNALWTLFRGEARGIFQRLIGQGRQMESGLVGITQPGATRHGQHLKEMERSEDTNTHSLNVMFQLHKAAKTHQLIGFHLQLPVPAS